MVSGFKAEFKWALMQACKIENFHCLLDWPRPFYPHHTFLCLALTKRKKRLGVGEALGGGEAAQGDRTSALCAVIIGVPRRIQEEN